VCEVLQLVEEGKLDLDAPAKRYAPEIGKLQVIEGFDAKGEPMLRAPKRDITTRMLMTHTAGLSYDFINHTYNRLAQEKGQPVITASKVCLMTPLLFDPGEWRALSAATSRKRGCPKPQGGARASTGRIRQCCRRSIFGRGFLLLRSLASSRQRHFVDAQRFSVWLLQIVMYDLAEAEREVGKDVNG
jgi:hypothetical protein